MLSHIIDINHVGTNGSRKGGGGGGGGRGG